MKTLVKVALVALVAVPMVACSGGDSEDEAPQTPATAPATGAEAAPAGAFPDGEVAPIGQTIWHGGFEVEFTQATHAMAEEQEGVYLLLLDARFTNPGPVARPFAGTVALVAGSGSYLPSPGSEIPEVPSGLAADGRYVYEVDAAFGLASAHLVVGREDVNQARVPLGPGGGELVDLAPSEPSVTGQLSMELLDFTIDSAELRADVPEDYQTVESGRLALTLNFTATSRKAGPSPGFALSADNFALVLPSGSAVGYDGYFLGGVSIPGNEAGIDTPDLFVRFLIDAPPTGEYTLRFSHRTAGEDTLSFSLA